MQQILMALFAGLIVGLIFSFLKLPLPAPPVLPGIMGIAGVYMGGLLFQQYISHYL